MTGKLFDRLVSAAVFVYALVLYLATMAETSPFWDSGEFIAIANGLQVSHPPGAPFYMLVGRLFAMGAPLFSGLSPEPVAFAVNLVSVLCSALTVLLTHFVILRLIRVWAGHPGTWSPVQRVGANAGGVIGALTFAVTDSFWFNAVEAEVYAMSMLFTALVVWLALVWRDATRAEEAALARRGEHPFGLHADRYLVAIAYLFGLAIGVHLLNVLTLFFIALVVFFQKVDRDAWTTADRVKGLAVTAVVSVVVFLVIYPGVVQTLPTLAGASGAPTLFLLAVIAALVGAVWYTQKKGMPLANLASLIIAMVILGYSSYGLIFIRSAADPPIDENDPETAEAIVSYLKREQYGSTPLLSGTTYDDRTGRVDEETTFPRRHSSSPAHTRVYAEYDSDLDFFLRYQLGHMYGRYFMWQFVGKAADVQDAGWIGGLGDAPAVGPTPSEQAGQNAYFWLPLLLGLIGLTVHVQRDWRRALAVGVLFLVTGVGIILYLNQTPLQPRERDYSYVASFFAFSLWIGIGATGLVEIVSEALEGKAASMRKVAGLAVAVLAFLAVPGWMAVENYDDHDRSGRRIATDFARNMLESTAPNAILFTNGDNDTFPLWYLQEVEGVRRDVRVVNLSLLNTPWYIRQLRDQWSRESAPIPMSVTDADLEGISGPLDRRATGALAPQLITDTEVGLPVDARAFSDDRVAGRVAPDDVPDRMTWTLRGQPYGDGQSVLYTADLAVLSILRTIAEDGWDRPVYFAGTVAESSELGLQQYFQNEGLARRVVPLARAAPGDADGAVVPEIALDRLGKFRFRGLADPDVYLDQNARNMADGYRIRFGTIAARLAAQGRPEDARALLDRLEQEVSPETVPASFGSLLVLAEAYERAGDADKAGDIFRDAESLALRQLTSAGSVDGRNQGFQYVQYIQSAYVMGGQYDRASAFFDRIAEALGDESIRRTPEQIRLEAEGPPPGAAPDAPAEES